ncbi:hypothetical protein [Stygiolobus caldivivus]|nr:hypothetical protein [Stygiolobus caldivivus]
MVKICPRCGTPNNDFSPMCVRCGYQFPPPTGYNPPPYVPPAGYTPPPFGKKKKSTPIVAVVVLVILVLAIGGYLYYKGVFTPARAPVAPSTVVSTYTSIMTTTVQPTTSTTTVQPTQTSTTVQPTTSTTTTVQPTPTSTSPPVTLEDLNCAVSFNGKDQYFIAPIFTTILNGKNTSLGMFSYIAMKYHEETIAVRAYLTPNTSGVLIGLSANTLPPSSPHYGWASLVYMSHGELIMAEYSYAKYQLFKVGVGSPVNGQVTYGMNVSITSPGFYWVVLEEWTNNNSTYFAGYINGQLIAELYAQAANASTLFGCSPPYNTRCPIEFSLIGTGYTEFWPMTNDQFPSWCPFNGSINSIVVYPYVLNHSQIAQLSNNTAPGGYFALFTASSKWYNQATGTWQAYNNPQLELTGRGDSHLITE